MGEQRQELAPRHGHSPRRGRRYEFSNRVAVDGDGDLVTLRDSLQPSSLGLVWAQGRMVERLATSTPGRSRQPLRRRVTAGLSCATIRSRRRGPTATAFARTGYIGTSSPVDRSFRGAASNLWRDGRPPFRRRRASPCRSPDTSLPEGNRTARARRPADRPRPAASTDEYAALSTPGPSPRAPPRRPRSGRGRRRRRRRRAVRRIARPGRLGGHADAALGAGTAGRPIAGRRRPEKRSKAAALTAVASTGKLHGW